MIRRTELLLVVLALLTALALVGTSSFASVTSERGVEVAVVDDDAAFLGIEQTTNTTANETTVDMNISNQFAGNTTLETVTVDGEDHDAGPLEPGDSVTIESLECDESVEIEALGPGTEVSLMRPVEC